MSGPRRLVLVGAGGAGREIGELIRSCPSWLARHGVTSIVHVDDRTVTGLEVVDTIDGYRPRPDDLVLCAVGGPALRSRLAESLEQRGARFTTFVHESAVVLPSASLGTGSVVYPNAVITTDVRVGRHAHISTAAVLGHDARIGDHVTVSGAAQVLGGAVVGDRSQIACSAVVLPSARVGDDVLVGAGSIVLRRARSGETVFGNPARTLSRSRA